ncbi:MAG: ATP-binding cassette domain-containing protein [Rhodospirillales bacterium]|nr:ATP-binding cassette domain-containing protein [Rhodospirillales bacterium]
MSALVDVRAASKVFRQPATLVERIGSAFGVCELPRPVHAVDDVSLEIRNGEVLGLVGESGCGKSTLGRMIAGILPPSAGSALFDGMPLLAGAGRPVKSTTRVQMIFQDPFASLDPRMRVGDIIAEGPVAHGLVSKSASAADVSRWLSTVGLDPQVADRYPHQFSGGQRQRIAIARALAMRPDMLVCDEPVASLDVSIQAQIVNLFLKLRRDLGLTMLFISHDLGVVRHVSDRIAIMYLGRIVEIGTARSVFERPRHPYTRALLDSVPRLRIDDRVEVDFRPIRGELPSPLDPPAGCHFHMRCPHANEACAVQRPTLLHVEGREVACLRATELDLSGEAPP